jgi:hypothetical protein
VHPLRKFSRRFEKGRLSAAALAVHDDGASATCPGAVDQSVQLCELRLTAEHTCRPQFAAGLFLLEQNEGRHVVGFPLRGFGFTESRLIISGSGAQVTAGSFNLWFRLARVVKYRLAAMRGMSQIEILVAWDSAA